MSLFAALSFPMPGFFSRRVTEEARVLLFLSLFPNNQYVCDGGRMGVD
jgi:hypothetical protein